MARQKQNKEALGEVVDANESETVVDEVKVRSSRKVFSICSYPQIVALVQ